MTFASAARPLGVALAATLALSAQAQMNFFEDAPAPKLPWEYFKLSPKARVTLDFRNANVDAVLSVLSKASGITIVKDPALTGGITLQSPKPQTLPEAFALLNATLGLRNFDLSKDGNFLVIKARPQQGRGGRGGGSPFAGLGGSNPFAGGANPFAGAGGGTSGAQVKVYALKYASATQVARVVNEVFVNSGQDAMSQILGTLGGGGGGLPIPPGGATLTPTSAIQDAAPSGLQEAALQGFGGGRGGGGGGFGGGGRGGGGFGGAGGGGFGGAGGGFNPFAGGRGGGFGGFGRGNSSVVRASADDFSNSVIVNAPRTEQEQVARLIEQIDKQTEQPQTSKVFPLQFANAADLVAVVQNLLNSNAPRGRGGGASAVPFEQRIQQVFRGGNAQSAFGTVVAEPRLNALIVTATADNLILVERVVKELDKDVTFENSTFVITLENARADQIAQLVNQSFGGRTGGNARAGGNAGRTGNAARNNGNAGGGGAAGGLNAGGGGRTGPNFDAEALALELAEVDAEAGALATAVTVQQGGGFGGFGGGGFGGGGNAAGGNRAQGTTRDAQGRVVNVLDLTGQVTAIPDINTNSVILVTSPQNRALLENILNQLDKIPEQVMIETLIVEASLDATSKLGVEWNFSQGKVLGDKNVRGSGSQNFGSAANTAQPQGMRYTLTGTQYGAFLNALQGDSRFEVLSTPRIFTSNNAQAQINISQSLPYVLSQRTDANGNLTFNYAFLDVGIILTVTPRITSNGYVTMDVTQTANDFVRYTDFNAPVVNQREAQTTVSVKDGETVVLGGIIKSSVSTTVNKLPLLGDIPVLGKLFRSTSETKSKTELLVFLTPRIVRDADEARRLRDETTKKVNAKTQDKINSAIIDPKPVIKPEVKTEVKPEKPDGKPN